VESGGAREGKLEGGSGEGRKLRERKWAATCGGVGRGEEQREEGRGVKVGRGGHSVEEWGSGMMGHALRVVLEVEVGQQEGASNWRMNC
jgi:hypothetical protein